ncbi:hypothetical protein Sta7437_4627 (plasmid) [Stanieria cyanosphaera PCC 7437]|uniref:Uncharacterized protein n=1 Tax=Stanieria cyanosphaera (strain ATCC 29371 / PCC 7437) TaxID=111780 RepID=K9XZT1_STAC7|nr:hypothetical protein [Stanieria cyanosphaera]AFZ38085.1 hypothetical protein Sta7437_4627 [Stanieria cyanosphaera PCC 7437]
MTKEKRLKIGEGLELRCSANSPLGEVINYLQKMPLNNLEMARSTLIARYLPFTLDLSQEEHRAAALACAIECESWGRAIREYCALPSTSISNPISVAQNYSVVPELVNDSSSPKEDRSIIKTTKVFAIKHEEDELEKFISKLQEIVDSSSSAADAKDKLIALQPEKDDSWTEAQWELWEEFTTKQETEADKQLLGDWGS